MSDMEERHDNREATNELIRCWPEIVGTASELAEWAYRRTKDYRRFDSKLLLCKGMEYFVC